MPASAPPDAPAPPPAIAAAPPAPKASPREGLVLPTHGLVAVLGAALLLLGCMAALVDSSLHRAATVIRYPIISTLLLTGACVIWLAWRSLQGNRAAWSFLLALSGTLSLTSFFASPRFHKSFELAWPVAMVPAALFLTAMLLLLALAPRYRH